MSELSLARSISRAEERWRTRSAELPDSKPKRQPRADRGRSRLAPDVEKKLTELLHAEGFDRPSFAKVQRELQAWCRRHRRRAPSRATLYNAVLRVDPPLFAMACLPDYVRRTLHNVGGPLVPGHQIVFAAFNYGDTAALSYAASLPWSCIERAARMRGFRPKSLALLRAIASCRGIRT